MIIERDESAPPLPYAQILDTAPDAMVVVDRHGTIVFVNLQAEKVFGRARAELRGKPLETLIPARFHGGHTGHVARYFTQPGTRPMGSNLALFGQRADGEEFPIEVSLSPVGTGEGTLVSAAIRDVSERKRVEADARIAAVRLAGAVESWQDPVALYNTEERLILCNSAFREFILSLGVKEPLGVERAEIEREIMAAATIVNERADELNDGAHVKSLDLRFRDGRLLRTMMRATADGGSVQTFWDLTRDAHREEELRVAREAADVANAAKSEFLSSMSHELRTPLNAILGFAQLMQRDRKEPLPARHLTRADQIIKGGEHLLRLINDILDLSRIEAGGISISTEPVSVADVLSELHATLEPIAARAAIALEMKPLPQSLPMVSVDRTRFVQILMNLGSNAIKYNKSDGRVTFVVSSPSDGRVRVTVRDTGIGIPVEKQEKLFQPFQRAGQETGPIEGTGIGLVITKRLAELMNGTVGFSSTPGAGTEFWVDVPVHAEGESTPAKVAMGAQAPSTMGAGERGVLYVEDNPANVLFMRDLLGTFDNVRLAVASTAEVGIELARTLKPEVIIMDINLPGMSGIDALLALQQLDETAHIPVIALTAAASPRDRTAGLEAGFFRYLAKPVQVAALEDALAELFANARRAST